MSTPVLTIVNKVLKKLRESTVTTIEGDDYAELITDFLTETKQEIEDAWDWTALKGTVLLDTIADAYRYKLSSVYEGSEIHSVYDQTNDCYLEFSPTKVDDLLKLTVPETGTAKYYSIVGYNDSEMLIDIAPVPDTANIRLYINGKYVQGDLPYTNPSTTLIATPMMPLVLGTYAKAVEERGEDDGEALTKAETKYARSLSDAIALDNANQGGANAQWEVE